MATSAEKKAKAVEALANILEEDNLEFLAKLAQEKGFGLNKSIRANQELIRKSL